MKLYKIILLFSSVLYLASCDPGLFGDLKIYNDTGQKLRVTYFDMSGGNRDTVVKDIQPNSYETLKVLSGLGDKSRFSCCPCEFSTIHVSSSTGIIKKDAANSDNWIIPNKRKLKKFGKEPVKCEFHVTASDI